MTETTIHLNPADEVKDPGACAHNAASGAVWVKLGEHELTIEGNGKQLRAIRTALDKALAMLVKDAERYSGFGGEQTSPFIPSLAKMDAGGFLKMVGLDHGGREGVTK